MNLAVTFLKKRFRVNTALVATFAALASVAVAQPRLSGVPSSDDIARALAAKPGEAVTAPRMRTRGLKLDAAAQPEPTSGVTPPLAAASSEPAVQDDSRRSSILMAAPASLQKQVAPRAVDLEIQFAFGSDRLTAEGRAVLDQLGKALHSSALADVSGIVLEGHTDGVGSASSNRALSLRRANSARLYLAQQHRINPTAIQAVGKGASELADPSNPADGVNRRVRVIVES